MRARHCHSGQVQWYAVASPCCYGAPGGGCRRGRRHNVFILPTAWSALQCRGAGCVPGDYPLPACRPHAHACMKHMAMQRFLLLPFCGMQVSPCLPPKHTCVWNVQTQVSALCKLSPPSDTKCNRRQRQQAERGHGAHAGNAAADPGPQRRGMMYTALGWGLGGRSRKGSPSRF